MNDATTPPTGIYGVAPPGVQATRDRGDAPALSCPLFEDEGAFRAHRSDAPERPKRLAFAGAVMRTDAQLTRTGDDGEATTGLAGSVAAGAVLVAAGQEAQVARTTVRRVMISGGSPRMRLPDQAGGWRWSALAAGRRNRRAPRQRLQSLMRSELAGVAERLCAEGWLTLLDGPLHGIRGRRGLPVVGYVKSHPRRLLDPGAWARVPGLAVGERSGLFAIGGERFAAFLRMAAPGPWGNAWSGIARIEVSAAIGERKAAATADRVQACLPRFASGQPETTRAAVALRPIAGLKRQLRHLQGEPRLALRAVRDAVTEHNREASA